MKWNSRKQNFEIVPVQNKLTITKKHAVKLPVANATEKSRCLQLNENKPSIYCFNFNSFLDTCDT